MSTTRAVSGRGRFSPATSPVLSALEAAIAAIEAMDLDRLRAEWVKQFHRPAPRCRSKDILRGLLAWQIQAEAHGGMSPETARRLRRLADNQQTAATRGSPAARKPMALMAGTVLTREWRGTLHQVQVLERGFAYSGRTYTSLSVIARAITGTRWSGPRFFGVAGAKRSRR